MFFFLWWAVASSSALLRNTATDVAAAAKTVASSQHRSQLTGGILDVELHTLCKVERVNLVSPVHVTEQDLHDVAAALRYECV